MKLKKQLDKKEENSFLKSSHFKSKFYEKIPIANMTN